MSEEKLQRLAQRVRDQQIDAIVADVGRTIALPGDTASHLKAYIKANRDPDYEDELRIAGATHLDPKEWLRRQLRGPWKFLVQPTQAPSRPSNKTFEVDEDGCPTVETCGSRTLTPEEQAALHRRTIAIMEGRHE